MMYGLSKIRIWKTCVHVERRAMRIRPESMRRFAPVSGCRPAFQIRILLTIITIGFGPALAMGASPSIVNNNNSGVGLLEEGKPFEASQYFIEGLLDSPEFSELHYNLGLAFEGSKEEEKAVKEYSLSAKYAGDPELRFQALFNAARLSGEMEMIDQALDYYQQALEIQPESEEIRHNIQLLLLEQGGGGGKDDKKDQGGGGKPEEEKEEKKDPEDDKKDQKEEEKPKPKEFKSQDLSKKDVKRILQELKRQEEKIRSKVLEKDPQEVDVDKDW